MATCIEKIRFSSSKAAKRKARQLRAFKKHLFQTYHCQECDGYHLTSKLGMGYKVKARSHRCENTGK